MPDGNAHRQEVWARGKKLGGSSAINGMVYMRGHPEDYDSFGLVGAFYKALPNASRPDAQLMMCPFTLDFASGGMTMERIPGFQLFSYGLRPHSQGHVRITLADPDVPACRVHCGSGPTGRPRLALSHQWAQQVEQAALGRFEHDVQLRQRHAFGHQRQHVEQPEQSCCLRFEARSGGGTQALSAGGQRV